MHRFIAAYRYDRGREKERTRLGETGEKKAARDRMPSEKEREREGQRKEPEAPFRLMNHAHAARACSIINAHLIQRSSSALEIFTKVRTTASLMERNRRISGNLSASDEEE